jgi:hypothetical protein
MVLIFVAVAGGIVFVVLWERKRYRMVMESDQEESREEAPAAAKKRDYMNELKRSLEQKRTEDFLKAAEKTLDSMKDNFSGDSMQSDMIPEVDKLKDSIYGYKFGGGTISEEAMKNIYEEIVRLKGVL